MPTLLMAYALLIAMTKKAILAPAKKAKKIPIFPSTIAFLLINGNAIKTGITADTIFVIDADITALVFLEAIAPNIITIAYNSIAIII